MYITGGKLKNRKIIFKKKIFYLKSTITFIRQMLFNSIFFYINNSYVLDCFSGSGILSFESLSRNANFLLAFENNYILYDNIIFNIKNLGYSKNNNIKIINDDIFNFLSKKKYIFYKKFNIVFIDPPFYYNLINKTIYLLENNNLLLNKSFIYIQYESEYKNKIIIPTN